MIVDPNTLYDHAFGYFTLTILDVPFTCFWSDLLFTFLFDDLDVYNILECIFKCSSVRNLQPKNLISFQIYCGLESHQDNFSVCDRFGGYSRIGGDIGVVPRILRDVTCHSASMVRPARCK